MGVSFNSAGEAEEKMARLGHELTHVLQWKNNEVGYILPSGNEQTTAPIALDNYDIGDELKAFKNMLILQHGADYYRNQVYYEGQINTMINSEFYMNKYSHTEYPTTTIYEGDYSTTASL